MKILIVNHEYSVTGASLMLLQIAGRLAASGHVCAVYSANREPGPIADAFRRLGMPLLDRPEFDACDFVLCNTIFTGRYAAAAAKRRPVIWWLHEAEIGTEALSVYEGLDAAFAAASLIVVQTAFERDEIYRPFVSRLGAEKFIVVPNGIDVPKPAHRVPKPLPLRVIALSKIARVKRVGDLIEAVDRLGRDDLDCIVVGRYHELRSQPAAIARASYGKFRLLGELPRDEAIAWLESADIFCHPSQSESFPLAILEAARLAKPLVLADLKNYRALWRHGENALLHRPHDVASLANAIGALAADPVLRERLGRAAQATAAPFTAQHFAADVDRVIAALTARAGLPR